MTVPTLAQAIPVLREALCDDKEYSTKELIGRVCERFEVGEEDRSRMSKVETCDAATAVWVATATLHRKHVSDGPFTTNQIKKMVKMQDMYDVEFATIIANICTHCVANSPAGSLKSSRQRKLTRVKTDMYRLFREGDEVHPDRRDGKGPPDRDDLPDGYKGLRKWYDDVYCGGVQAQPPRGAGAAR